MGKRKQPLEERKEDFVEKSSKKKPVGKFWQRPPLKKFNAQKKDIGVHPNSKQAMRIQRPILRLYGVNEEGNRYDFSTSNSVLAHIHRFDPYFYIAAWGNFENSHKEIFQDALESKLRESPRAQNYSTKLVTKIEVVENRHLLGYRKELSKFLKIYLVSPSFVSLSRTKLSQSTLEISDQIILSKQHLLTYESNIPFVLRYMIDRDVKGGGWVSLKKGQYTIRSGAKKTSRCQLEVDINYEDIAPMNDKLEIAPLRVLSFDIECCGRKGVFPEPKEDPVIQIANYLQVYQTTSTEDPYLDKSCFVLNGCANIAYARILSFENEKKLLSSWKEYFNEVDPDVITGYNTINFDVPYLIERAESLKVNGFPYFGRISNQKIRMKDKTFSSKAYGIRENKEISISGRGIVCEDNK